MHSIKQNLPLIDYFPMFLRLKWLFIVLMFLTVLCFDESHINVDLPVVKNSYEFDLAQLEIAKNAFLQKEPAHYSYIFTSKRFHTISYKVTMSNHVVASIQASDLYSDPSFKSYYDSQSVSIVAIFDEITDRYYGSYDKYVDTNEVYTNGISVEYDTGYYFPSKCTYSWFIPKTLWVDGNNTWSIDSFKVLD